MRASRTREKSLGGVRLGGPTRKNERVCRMAKRFNPKEREMNCGNRELASRKHVFGIHDSGRDLADDDIVEKKEVMNIGINRLLR
jgi:hypothetical protein